jgi:phage head maturation protease
MISRFSVKRGEKKTTFASNQRFAVAVDPDAQTATITGTAIVLGSVSFDGCMSIAPTALQDAPDLSDVMLLAEHCGLPHARTTSGTLQASVTGDGLGFDGTVNLARTDSSDLAICLADGNVYGCSWGAMNEDLDFGMVEGVETITAIRRVYEITICGSPVFPAATAQIAGAAPVADTNVAASIDAAASIALRRTHLKALRASIIGGQPRG